MQHFHSFVLPMAVIPPFGIYLNDALDEQEGLTVSKWDLIAEEMY
jgi:hypothetical protein